MTTMIDVLSDMKGGIVNGKFDKSIKAPDYGSAILTLITPSYTTVEKKLLDYPTAKNVRIQRFTEED